MYDDYGVLIYESYVRRTVEKFVEYGNLNDRRDENKRKADDNDLMITNYFERNPAAGIQSIQTPLTDNINVSCDYLASIETQEI